MKETAELWRHELVEKAAELDDDLMEAYLEDEHAVTIEQIKKAPGCGTQ